MRRLICFTDRAALFAADKGDPCQDWPQDTVQSTAILLTLPTPPHPCPPAHHPHISLPHPLPPSAQHPMLSLPLGMRVAWVLLWCRPRSPASDGQSTQIYYADTSKGHPCATPEACPEKAVDTSVNSQRTIPYENLTDSLVIPEV